MCGICGKICYSSANILSEELIKKMCHTLVHRGPDDEGLYLNLQKRAGLGHRRLSIIDLSPAGRQPMCNETGTIWIVMNGEIYNFMELRDELIKKGHVFKSKTDTEVIVHLYEEKGIDCVKALTGMFAFAIWDEIKEQLFLARDRIGKKPLHYALRNGNIVFGSEIKAILQDPEVSKEVNVDVMSHYLSYGYVASPHTMFAGINKLPPACTLIYKNGDIKIEKYWQLDFSKKLNLSESEYENRALYYLREATKSRLISDVPLGVFLSGGIDSSAVVYMMNELSSSPVKTFSIGFEEDGYNELEFARIVSKAFGTDHHEYIVKPDVIDMLPKLVWHYNEPFADSSALPSFYVAKMARQEVTVALNGDGGDENFAGYERYLAGMYAEYYGKLPVRMRDDIVSFLSSWIPKNASRTRFISKFKRFISMVSKPYKLRHYHWVSIFQDTERECLYTSEFRKRVNDNAPFNYLNNIFEQSHLDNIVDSLLNADINSYLPEDLLVKMDIATMANSLEGRSPFLDHRLMEFAASMPSGMKIKGLRLKYILKKSLRGILPKVILNRSKKGFGVPVDKWFRSELKDYSYEILLSSQFIKRGYFKRENIKNILDNHLSRKANNGAKIWSLLNLELWHRMFIDTEKISI